MALSYSVPSVMKEVLLYRDGLGEGVQLLVQGAYLGVGEGFGVIGLEVGDLGFADGFDLALQNLGLVFGQLPRLQIPADLDILLPKTDC